MYLCAGGRAGVRACVYTLVLYLEWNNDIEFDHDDLNTSVPTIVDY